jgi:diguanylate cyclase (GGDEF)-like protein/PAS domain S-box-containing protein
MASIFENTLEGISVTSTEGTIEKVNPGFTTITGYSAEEVIGKNPRILKSDRHDADFYAKMWESVKTKGFWHGEVWNRKKNGEVYPEWLAITAIRDYKGDVSNYVAVFHDISELKHNEEQLKFQAFYDALTGLPNRVLFMDRLNTALIQAKRNKQQLAVLFLDLDNFKNVNDTLGHYAGDLMLIEVAHRLKKCAREEDTVARMSGDEFTIILQELSDEWAPAEVAERILQQFEKAFKIKGTEFYISASIGITYYPTDGTDTPTLIKNADMAMYKIKETGKNSYAFFTPEMQQAVVHRIKRENQLRDAIQNNEFEVYYQPKIRTSTSRLSGAEALVRWIRKDGEIISPEEFIPLAEQTGLIIPLGEYVLRTACARARKWYDEGFDDFTIAVNISALQFRDKDLINLIENILKETRLPAHLLNLEITESIVMTDINKAIDIISKLSKTGTTISLDDFGTGHSSLSYLKQFSLDMLKIDKSFVTGLPEDGNDAAIARMIISLAKTLNLKVVAEGVETREQFCFMCYHRCDEIQGYLFSPPLNSADMTKLLHEKKQFALCQK